MPSNILHMIKNDLLLRALKGEVVERPPVWMMRQACLLYTSPSPRDVEESRMPSSA